MKKYHKFIIIALVLIFVTIDTMAQCPMCRMAAESNLENGGTEGKGLNMGILYMLSLPYLLIATIGYIWFRNRKEDSEVISDRN